MPKVLFIGDIVGRPARSFIKKRLPQLRTDLSLDLVIANAENSAGGSGLTAKIAGELREMGIDGITLGDHTWDQRGFEAEIDALEYVCRPANVPNHCPGRHFLILECGGFRLGVFTVLGRQWMKLQPDSFALQTADRLLGKLADQTDGLVVEIHAEATAEKVALGWYLDGRVAAVVGTHTHVPTADAQLLPRSTGYLTDIGMTGPYQSCIGRDLQAVIASFLDGMPRKHSVAQHDVRLCGVILNINADSGLCDHIERLEVRE